MDKFDPNESMAEPLRYFWKFWFIFDVLEEEAIRSNYLLTPFYNDLRRCQQF